ncbi:hypothetical protein F5J12DRAFT_944819 [Pisolithus orientalis]|uniref:uncharacterized protein n=1 Tax=Pisolithus orientalis TaxID=936130 RepID=UPI002224ABBF|nr:uncharacterized protein F5J12DRAFT_944819 [Pisolithus orientalis]KAI6032606.1 hypothetical protein F5J12DRAFT_944819 [Pisolithus orientalis]
MHFSKTYSQLLLTLSPELRDNAIEYRRLKKLINETVVELHSLGFTPAVLQQLLEQGGHGIPASTCEDTAAPKDRPTVTYEISSLQPRLRITLGHGTQLSNDTISPLAAQEPLPNTQGSLSSENAEYTVNIQDIVLPLRSDTAFLCLLASELSSLSDHFATIYNEFTQKLIVLATSISSTARPVSSSAPHSFSAYLLSANNVTSVRPGSCGKSDLYFWREVFQQYVQAEIFEGIGEAERGERSIDEAERRLVLFHGRVTEKARSLRIPTSEEALDMFFKINAFILDVKKVRAFDLQPRKLHVRSLKKHTKRTALPIPAYLLCEPGDTPPSEVVLSTQPLMPLQRLLVQAIGEKLLPVVPYIDDYSCLICTSIAFKPVRLDCGHLFCVRCLVKLQKQGKPNCPLCRAPTVLKADRNNVDYALLNFMSDWFPTESRAKLRANELEAAKEELEELGFPGATGCVIM